MKTGFQLLIEASKHLQAPLCIADAKNNPVYVNQEFLTLTGFSTQATFLAAGALGHLLPTLEAIFLSQLQLGHSWQGKVQIINSKREFETVLLSASPLQNAAATFMGTLYLFTPHTKEQPLPSDDKHMLLESFVEHANDAVMITEAAPIDEPGPRIVYVNPAFTRMTHYTADEVAGKNPRFLQGPKTDRLQLNKIRKALENKSHLKVELINYKKNGDEFWVNFSLVPVSTKAGIVTHYVSIQREITTRKIAEQALQESQQQLKQALLTNQQILNYSLDVICTIDREGKFVQLSPACERLWGYTPEELSGRHFVEFVVPEDKSKSISIAKKVIEVGQVNDFENRYQHKNGSIIPMMWAGTWSEEDQLIYTTARDISERKAVELKLQKSEQLYRTVVENFPNGSIAIVDQRFTFMFLAGQGLSKVKLTPEDFIGKSFKSLLPPKVADETIEALSPTFDGIPCSTELSAHGLQFLCHTVPLYENNKVTSFLMVSQDITELKAAEEKLRKYTEQLEKINGELDQFVYKTSHDLRAPLVSLLGLINLSRLSSSTIEQQEYLRLMERSVKKLDSFIHDIIDYSRSARSATVPQQINFTYLLQESIEHLKYMEDAKAISMRINVRPLSGFFSDQKRLEVILNNILSNAIRYRDPRKETSFIHIDVQPQQQGILLRIEDNGLGIAREHQPKIYDMFYRATDTNVGSGLGLYIVKENVIRLKGSVSMESTLGKGSTFSFYFPSLKE